MFKILLALFVILANEALAGGFPPPPPAATIFTNLPLVDKGYGVLGRDTGLSIRVGSNCCFLFGDTVLTQANFQGSTWVVNTLYHTTNSNGDNGVTGGYNYVTNGTPPIQFIPYTADETNWNATNANHYFYGIWPIGQFYSPGDSNQYIAVEKVIEQTSQDFGMGLAICPTNPVVANATRVQSRPGNAQSYMLWDPSDGDYGHMCCTMSNYVYAYFVNGTNYGVLYVARASLLGNPPAFLTKSNWEYWNGAGWVVNSPSSAAYLFSGTGIGTIDWNAYLTNDAGGRGCYLYTYMSWVGNQIYTRASSDLVHWSGATLQYTAPFDLTNGNFPYFGRAAKCLEKNNGQTIYITWSIPDTNIFYPENMPMIRAEFPMVTPAFSHLTASQSIAFGMSNITLSGMLSANGAFPASGETIAVTIGTNTRAAAITDPTGDFSVNFDVFNLPASNTSYGITYAYPGDGALYPVTNASTTLSVTPAFGSVTATIAMPAAGQLSISFLGLPYETYVLQTTTNLSGPWEPISTNTANSNGAWQFVNPEASNAQQFYEVTGPP